MEDLKPGRKLDQMIAETVMGSRDKLLVANTQQYHERVRREIESCPYYSTDIAAAWDVLGVIKKMGDGWWMYEVGDCSCRWYINDNSSEGNPFASASGDSTPHAICLAALKAVEK